MVGTSIKAINGEAGMGMKWIEIEEQTMPKMFTQVLVAQDTGAVFVATFEAVDGWFSANNLPIEEPTHWMPLPEPPE